MTEQLSLEVYPSPDRSKSFSDRARLFCDNAPHRSPPFSKRNWGGVIHSLCSYQGKLKPAIAHFLVSWFTEPGEIVLDPMSGVGTIPFEARRLGRVGIANDLSPLAFCVSSAKLAPISVEKLEASLSNLKRVVRESPSLSSLSEKVDVDWGLNRTIREYFHEDTLREVLAAREFFLESESPRSAETNLLQASLLHILHGNRPYALSRRSHPVTPLAPSGPFEYRSLIERLETRLTRVLPELLSLAEVQQGGVAYQGDFRSVGKLRADAIITSPPFIRSLRFWSSNWMRLWFAGWGPADFQLEPERYLESQQRVSYAPYRDFALACAESLPPGGKLILHLGETASENMADLIAPLVEPEFRIVHIGREDVGDTESHGLSDKGATVAHWYLFAERV